MGELPRFHLRNLLEGRVVREMHRECSECIGEFVGQGALDLREVKGHAIRPEVALQFNESLECSGIDIAHAREA